MRQRKRKKFTLPRRDFLSEVFKSSDEEKKPDIINIWEEQKRLRAEAVQLEKEYELARRRVKQLQIQIKQRNKLLSDSETLQTTLTEDVSRTWQNSRLWVIKTYKQFKLRLTIFYLKNRQRLGIPLRKRTIFRREKAALVIITVAIFAGVLVLFKQTQTASPSQSDSNQANNSALSDVPLNQTPEFTVLKPSDRDIAALGGYAKISPEGSASVYAYIDEVNGIRIRVSQQELPSNIKRDSDELEKLAHDFNANRTIFADKDTIYIGESTKGPQSVILQKNGLLILISSDSKISDEAWKAYIQLLVPAQ